jgi:hypothetical protein
MFALLQSHSKHQTQRRLRHPMIDEFIVTDEEVDADKIQL